MKQESSNWAEFINSVPVGSILNVTVTRHHHFGFFVAVPGTKHEGLIEILQIRDEQRVTPADFPTIGAEVEAVVIGFRERNRQIMLSMKPGDFPDAGR